ncbi:hypothetical protein GCM10023340_36840 [Nocardioides marinquilinus]|uniref:Guanylate cyclase domain-containing protein n=1 Tax=Nocardioides marinquilinus TaxID=1210400 RepID=A0ABP9PZ12_9ACTN
MSGTGVATVAALAAGVVALAALVALAVALRALSAQRAELARTRARVDELEADLTAALKPRPAATPAEKAVARVVRTASRTAGTVRERGLAGLVQTSIDELQAWADTRRQEIVNVADAEGRVTLLFSDIEDSTVLNHELGDRRWVRLLAAHDAVVRGQVERYRGQVVKTAGDGFMVAFRDVEAACRAALGVHRELRRRPRTAAVRVRIGVHTGAVVSRDGDFFGRNVVVAARLGALAAGGQVLTSDAVHDALDDDAAVALVEAGEVELKGLPGSHRVWQVQAR